MTKEAASRTLNYELKSDIMNRVKKAGFDKERDKSQVAAGVDAVTGVITKGLDAYKKKIEEEEKESQKLSGDFMASFEKQSEIGSWVTPKTFEQFANAEREHLQPYLEAVEAEDKDLQARLLREQSARSASIQGWKGIFEENKKIFNDELHSASMPDSVKKIFTALNTQDPAQGFGGIKVDPETNEAYFEVNPEFVKGTALEEKNGRINLKDYQDMLAANIKATDFSQVFMEENELHNKQGRIDPAGDTNQESKIFDTKKVYNSNLAKIKKEQIGSIFHDEGMFGKGSEPFKDILLTHGDFNTINAENTGKDVGNISIASGDKAAFSEEATEEGKISGQQAVDDGIVTGEEFAKLGEADKKLIIAEMMKPENADIAKSYIAEYMTLVNLQNHQTGQGVRSQTRRSMGADFDPDKFE